MYKTLFSISMIFLLSCNSSTSEKEPGTPAAPSLVGEWNNIYLKVDINSKNNTDSNDVLEVDRSAWEEKLKIKPIRSFFRKDSTWNSAHYNLNDSLVYDPSGKWWTNGDQLTMLRLIPSPDTTIYTYSIKNDTVSFEATLDWDGDGKRDDRYFGRQIRKSN